MKDLLDTITQILLLEKMRRDEGITEAQVLVLEAAYKKLGYKKNSPLPSQN